MPQCRAVTKSGKRCTKATKWFKYCWLHKEYFTTGTASIIIGLLFSIFVLLYQERNPFISVKCNPVNGWDIKGIECSVHNSGRSEARDVYVSFNRTFPIDTELYAPLEVGAEINPSSTPPNPQIDPAWSETQLAFAIRIPRVAPKDTISFQVKTTNPDNMNAANQMLRIREEYSKVIKMIIERIEKANPEEARKINFDKLMSLKIKHGNIFSPAHFSYEKGRQAIEYFTDEEQEAHAIFKDMHDRHKEILKNILVGRPRFIAPVIRMKTGKGEGTYISISNNINYCFDLKPIPFSELKSQGNFLLPQKYLNHMEMVFVGKTERRQSMQSM